MKGKGEGGEGNSFPLVLPLQSSISFTLAPNYRAMTRLETLATQAKILPNGSKPLLTELSEAEYALRPSRFSFRGRGGCTRTKIILGSNFTIRFFGANITSPGVENIKRANMSNVKIPKRSSRGIGAPYTVFTNGGHAGKNWCLIMKARRWRINKNCK